MKIHWMVALNMAELSQLQITE